MLIGQESKAAANRRLAKKRVQWLNEALCFASSSVLRNRQLLVAAKRGMHRYRVVLGCV